MTLSDEKGWEAFAQKAEIELSDFMTANIASNTVAALEDCTFNCKYCCFKATVWLAFSYSIVLQSQSTEVSAGT
jgi:hypothetical protein